MSETREILDRMNSIRETKKVTNAMYLISSSKIRKAKDSMHKVQFYYDAIYSTIGDILATSPSLEHKYLESLSDSDTCECEGFDRKKHKRRAYLVITADKGLAGAYNLNVIKKVEAELKEYPDAELFVMGQVGLHHFARTKAFVNEEFKYSTQNPNLQRARNITSDLLDEYNHGDVGEIYVIYTRMKNSLESEAVKMKVLPLSREAFDKKSDGAYREKAFFPNEASVFTLVAPLTMQGVIFTALTESYCAELNDRMSAMNSATENADKMLQTLELDYNRKRQGSITQEITEIIAGTTALRNKNRM